MVFSTGLGYQEAEGKKFSAGSWKLAWSGVINPHWKDGHARIHGEKISIEYQLVQRMLFDLRGRLSWCKNIRNTTKIESSAIFVEFNSLFFMLVVSLEFCLV